MNTPEERNANHSSVDAQSGSSVDTGTPVVPEEITELADLHATATANVEAAQSACEAAYTAFLAARDAYNVAADEQEAAEVAQMKANAGYIDALIRHGYVQTADGPKPRA